MMKRAFILALVVSLFLGILSPSLAQVQVALTVLKSSAQVTFPSSLDLSLSVESDVNISDIRLRYKIEDIGFAQVTNEAYVNFTPATTVDAKWSLNMVEIGGLPPGTAVEYWWVVTDTKGAKVETVPVQVLFDDNRYQWRHLTEGMVTIYWYEGNDSFAQNLMTTGQQALTRLTQDLAISGGFLEVRPDRIIILADAAERAEEIDIARAEEAKARAKDLLSRHPSEVDYAVAEAALRRSLIRLKVAERKKKRKLGP